MTTESLHFIVRNLLKRSKIIQDSDIDTSALVDHRVEGFIIKDQKPIRNALGELQKIFFFDGNEQDFLLHIQSRGVGAEVTIPEENMGAGLEEPLVGESVEITRESELDLPQEIAYEAMDINNDYWGHIERSQRLVIEQDDKHSIRLGVVTNSDQLAQAVQIGHSTIWIERDKFRMTLLRKFSDLTVGMILKFTKKGNFHRFRINAIEYTVPGIIVVEGHREEVGQFDNVAAGTSGGRGTKAAAAVGDSVLFFLDAPMLKSEHDDEGYYVSIGKQSRHHVWKGASLFLSKDDSFFGLLEKYVTSAPNGVLISDISNGQSVTWSGQVMKIHMNDGSLFSATKPAVLAGENIAFLLDPNGDVEYIQWATAMDNGDNTFDLSNLLRGRRGTELPMDTHVVDVLADVDLGSVPSNNSINFRANLRGIEGNNILVEIVTPVVGGPKVTSSIDSAGIITIVIQPDDDAKTANEVITMISADAYFKAALTASNTAGSNGSGNVAAVAETALTGGIDGTKFAHISTPNTKRMVRDLDEIGLTRFLKAVSVGQLLDDVSSQSVVNAAKGKFPYAPSQVRGTRNGSGDITITWRHRTRFGGAWKDLIDVPLNETTEDYEIDIMDGAAVVRTFTGIATESQVYTSAQQITDFGSNQDPVTVRVYQTSSVVGRGFKREAAI